MLGILGRDRFLLHGYVLERRRDHGRHEDLLCPGPWFGDSLDSDIILYAGRGQDCDRSLRRSILRPASASARLSGGTRTLDGIRARVDVSHLGGPDLAWDGTYRFQ